MDQEAHLTISSSPSDGTGGNIQDFEDGLTLLCGLVAKEVSLHGAQPSSASSTTSVSSGAAMLLKDWLSGPGGPSSNIMWLGGVPDSFSADDAKIISQDRCPLVASFSFSSRKGSEQVQHLVLALAHQVTTNIPLLRQFIGSAIARNPAFLSQRLDIQLNTIIFDPFRECATAKGSVSLRSFILIDGLDLYHDVATQRLITSTIEMVATTHSIPLRFLFTSQSGPQEQALPLIAGTHLYILNSSPPQHLSAAGTSSLHKKPDYHGFPNLVQVQSCVDMAEAYTRSLLLSGHGIPLWYPAGDLDSPPSYLYDGAQLGDVMFIDQYGISNFIFNIFKSRDDPVNRRIMRSGNRRYEPLPLDPAEVIQDDHYFSPGTCITSEGAVASKKCDNPLTINFKSNSDEGAFLVLPDGASRQDLVSTTRFHRYVQRWAPYWYKYEDIPNGSLFMVTGCDKASDFAAATFFSNTSHSNRSQMVDIDFVGSSRGENPWKRVEFSRAHVTHNDPEQYSSESISAWAENRKSLCVFVRGMRIAIGSAAWASYNTSTDAREAITHTQILHKPGLFDRGVESILVNLHRRLPEFDALHMVPRKSTKEFFHPVFIIAPELLQQYPNASVLVLNDSDWCTLTRPVQGNWENMKALIDKFYNHFHVTEENGVIAFTRKDQTNKMNSVKKLRESIVSRFSQQEYGPLKVMSISKYARKLRKPGDSDDSL